MSTIPTPLRAALGLVADAVDAARTLPERAVELPVLAVSAALQLSLRAQQRYAELTLRGDELLGRLHAPPEEPPSWATFDDDPARAGRPEPTRTGRPGPVPGGKPDPTAAGERPGDVPAAPADAASGSPRNASGPAKGATVRPRPRKAPAKKTAATSGSTSKAVRPPRQAKPSPFDRTDDG